MKTSSPPLSDAPALLRDAVVRKWLSRTLETYPEQTSRFLLQTRDPFRNPVGRALADGLPLLFEEIAGGFDMTRIRPVLNELVHIRAVQDFSPSKALGFILLLRDIVREESNPTDLDLVTLDSRIDALALEAFDLYSHCREKMAAIKVNEAKRRVFVLERLASRDMQDAQQAPK